VSVLQTCATFVSPLQLVMLLIDGVHLFERADDRLGESFDDVRIAHRAAEFFDVRDQDGSGEREDLIAVATDVFRLRHDGQRLRVIRSIRNEAAQRRMRCKNGTVWRCPTPDGIGTFQRFHLHFLRNRRNEIGRMRKRVAELREEEQRVSLWV
jgi:phosphatidylserine/phosphatidylglycerophosphate/cardiolipin synthase-like enzyme